MDVYMFGVENQGNLRPRFLMYFEIGFMIWSSYLFIISALNMDKNDAVIWEIHFLHDLSTVGIRTIKAVVEEGVNTLKETSYLLVAFFIRYDILDGIVLP